MWFSFSKWTWVKLVAKTLLYSALVVSTLFAVMYSIVLNRQTNYEMKELQECCDRCKMVPEVKKCQKLQVDYYGLSDAVGRRRPQAKALWDASGCRGILDKWAKHAPPGQ